MNGIAGPDGGRVAEDARLVGIPCDSVAAAEDGERAERFETADGVLELRARAIAPPRRGAPHPSVDRDQAGSDLGKPASGVEYRELAFELLHTPLPRRQHRANETREHVRELGGVSAAHRDPRRQSG